MYLVYGMTRNIPSRTGVGIRKEEQRSTKKVYSHHGKHQPQPSTKYEALSRTLSSFSPSKTLPSDLYKGP